MLFVTLLPGSDLSNGMPSSRIAASKEGALSEYAHVTFLSPMNFLITLITVSVDLSGTGDPSTIGFYWE